MEITTASSNPFVRLLSSDDIIALDAEVTDSGGNSTIELDADQDILCTNSTLDANTVIVSAGGTTLNCP